MSTKSMKPVALAISAAVAGSLAASSVAADTSPFSMTTLTTGYMLDMNPDEAGADGESGERKGEEGKCGEGKCGEGKCGEKKGAEGKCGEHKGQEGKCGEKKGEKGKGGEGKCGGHD